MGTSKGELNSFLDKIFSDVMVCENEDCYVSADILNAKILYLADILKDIGIKEKDRVVIYLPRGIDGMVVIHAITLIGGVYVPLSIKDPDVRILDIIEGVNPKLIIGKGKCLSYIKHLEWLNIDALDFDKLVDKKNIPIFLSTEENPAVILYTSGSTGYPKGIVLSRRAVKSFVYWAGDTFSISNVSKIASLAPLNFDLSLFDIFTSLNFGASVYFIPDNLTMSPSQLTTWLIKHEITIWYTVPSMLTFWVSKGNLKHTLLPRLKTILFAGEVLPVNMLMKLVRFLPQVEFYNLYGPTETNVCCYWKVDKSRLSSMESIPIGRAACKSQLQVNSSNNELMMMGPNLMSGYWNGRDCILPVDGNGWFCTGDEVEMNEYGEYLYVGRLNRMIKYFGHRIEPNEVEKALYHIPEVLECVVIEFKGNKGESIIGAYIVAENTTSVRIKNSLKKYLPSYMIPTFFYMADSLPKLANGKTDLISAKEKMSDNYA